MKFRLAGIRPGEGRDTAAAFLTLFGLMAGHSLLETARDALFLAKIDAVRLPLVYIAIAALAIGITRVAKSAGRPARLSLSLWIAGGALVTFGFWTIIDRAGTWSLYALYIWSGLLATLLVVRFWLVAGELFTVSQAKRVFAIVGTGSILGAVAGSAVAQAIAFRFAPRDMLLAAGAALLAAAAGPLLFGRDTGPEPRAAEADPGGHLLGTLRAVWGHPYVRRMAGLVLVSTVALTVADLVFKATIAEGVSTDQLAWVFALIYMIVNVLSLLVQLVLVGWATRNLSIDRVLSILPLMLILGSVWFLLGGGLLAAVLIKGFDGTLRHSLHRTASEVLSVPLPADWRRRVKSFIDVTGQRGGQALASLAFLAIASFGTVGAGGRVDMVLGTVLVVLAVAWVLLAAGLKRHYFDLFRNTLEEGAVRTRIEFPDLDLASLETLMTALSSPDESEVAAALDLLAEKGRVRLIPALVLYHPSPRVVVRALELFEAAGRTDHRRLLERLLGHANPEVRTAVLLSLPADETDPEILQRALADESEDVRATALIGLYFRGDTHPRTTSILETMVHAGSAEAKAALARAIGRRPDARFAGVLQSLAATDDPAVAHPVARAMRSQPDPVYLGSLRGLLRLRAAREEARRALVSIGKPALGYLAESLEDEELDAAIRRHLPRTISRFDPVPAAEILLRRLPVEPDGAVRFKILRALGFLRSRNPGLPLDRSVLDTAIESTVATVLRLIDWKRSVVAGTERNERWRTPVRDLVVELLDHKRDHAVERLFRLFGLSYPREDFRSIHRGVCSPDPKARASARELLEGVLRPPLRDAVLGMLDDVPDAERLAAGRRYYRARHAGDEEILRILLEEGNIPLRSLVAYHVGELGMGELRDSLADLCEAAVRAMEESFRSAIDLLDDPGKEKAFVVPLR